jgi:hydroxymethylglutaryl-CoA lyase
MADAAEVVRHALTLPGLTVMALVPNLRAPRPHWAGVHKITLPVSASAAHSLANVRKTRVKRWSKKCAAIDALRTGHCARHVKMEAGISTAFGCTCRARWPRTMIASG